jgi:hypothetical protein
MDYLFNYDGGRHKHLIIAIEVRNEKNELLGYRPVVARDNSMQETPISERYSDLKYRVFTNKRLCREFAVEFFSNLEKE